MTRLFDPCISIKMIISASSLPVSSAIEDDKYVLISLSLINDLSALATVSGDARKMTKSEKKFEFELVRVF